MKHSPPEKRNVVYVVVLDGQRYFYGFNRRGHMMSSYTLAGAEFFGAAKDAIAIKHLAEMKGKGARVEALAPVAGGAA